jgi:hypothetical protein
MHHGSEDHRELVAVFDNEAQMAEHAALLREEEWRFVQERFKHERPKLVLNFRQQAGSSERQQSCSRPELSVARPPSYSEPTAGHVSNPEEAESLTEGGHPNTRNKRQRVSGEFQGLQTADQEIVEELPEYAQIA